MHCGWRHPEIRHARTESAITWPTWNDGKDISNVTQNLTEEHGHVCAGGALPVGQWPRQSVIHFFAKR